MSDEPGSDAPGSGGAGDVSEVGRLARGWDDAAEGYEAYFVPRFAPWVEAAVEALGTIPAGPILVPCCGTFPELPLLVERFPDQEIVGIDLSAGMVRIARDRAAAWPQVSVIEGDAATLDRRWTANCAAVVSVFGLQQLPKPDLAIQSWFKALRPGGRLSVVYWPSVTEDEGPFALLKVVRRSPPADHSWENRLADSITALGATVDRDDESTYPMTHPDAATFFEAFTRYGPMRATANARGDAYIDQLRKEFLHHAPPGEWTHHPHARRLAAQR